MGQDDPGLGRPPARAQAALPTNTCRLRTEGGQLRAEGGRADRPMETRPSSATHAEGDMQPLCARTRRSDRADGAPPAPRRTRRVVPQKDAGPWRRRPPTAHTQTGSQRRRGRRRGRRPSRRRSRRHARHGFRAGRAHKAAGAGRASRKRNLGQAGPPRPPPPSGPRPCQEGRSAWRWPGGAPPKYPSGPGLRAGGAPSGCPKLRDECQRGRVVRRLPRSAHLREVCRDVVPRPTAIACAARARQRSA